MLPQTTLLELEQLPHGVLHVTLARENFYNAVNSTMMAELSQVFTAIQTMDEIRIVVVRGKGGNFSAGGDLAELTQTISSQDEDADRHMFELIRKSGRLLTLIDRTPKIVIAVLEGTVLGTGLGIACVSDIVIAHADAVLSLPEVTIGFPPSQIAPFLLRRIGPSGARMLALTGLRISGREARNLGLAHVVGEDRDALDKALSDTVARALRCGPFAVADTKGLLHDLGPPNIEQYLDDAASKFIREMKAKEGLEGLNAFLSKRAPSWSPSGAPKLQRQSDG